MRVILAQPRGFCAGVVRAIEIVEKALDKYGEPVYVRHEIVHNKHVVDKLKDKGARFVEELDEVPEGAVTVFSAHGVPQSVVKTAQDAACRCWTPPARWCPRSTTRASAMSPMAARLILIGHAGHPEVEGTMGQVGAPVTLVQHEADVAALDIPPETPVAYITQTTLSIDDTKGIIAALKNRFSDIVGPGNQRHLLRHPEPPDLGARAGQDRRCDPGGGRGQQLQLQPPARDRHRGRHSLLSDQ